MATDLLPKRLRINAPKNRSWSALISVLIFIALTPVSLTAQVVVDSQTSSMIRQPLAEPTVEINPSTQVSADELWMVNTRCITSEACRADLLNPTFSTSVYDGGSHLVKSDLETLVNLAVADQDTVNIIYVHGNNFEANEVMERAWFVYQRIRCSRRLGTPIRFIVWSWPSQPETSPLKDVRLKAARTDAQGLYLALFLRQIAPAARPITLIGYSFGGRVVTGSLHALAGGSLGGRVIPGQHLTGLEAHVGLVAPALDNDWLMSGQYHGRATKNTHRISLMYNPRDQILRRYWILDPRDWPRALGQSGGMRFGTGVDGKPVVIKCYNCSRTIGRRHEEEDYYSSTCGAGRVMAELVEGP